MNSTVKKPISFDKKTATIKAESWCAYQERSQQEMRNKLYEWGLHEKEVEEIITELILSNFLNEERFAFAYVSGKVNIKKWGKIKIKQGLKLKKVPEKMIQKVLASIDDEKYIDNLTATALKKSRVLNEKDAYKRKHKLFSYLQGKGFEADLIIDVLKANNLSN
jgi:regulatory protein